MFIGHQMEKIRKECGLTVVDMCNALSISEGDWRRIAGGRLSPTTYQLCMFIMETRHGLDI